jgi:hypothetical protein
MNEINYGFINENNLLIGFASCIENDFETIERVKKEYGAYEYHPLNGAIPYINECYWNGSTFTTPKPFSSWHWDSEKLEWAAPKEVPDINLNYYWDEIELDWVLISD